MDFYVLVLLHCLCTSYVILDLYCVFNSIYYVRHLTLDQLRHFYRYCTEIAVT
jgi:hypothetical protein